MHTDLPICWDIFEEHLSEATFLWTQWESALVAPNHTLDDLGEWEERLLAHLDGLVLGGPPVAERLLDPALEADEPTRISAATFALVAEGEEGFAPVLGVLEKGLIEQQAAIQRALEVVPREDLGPRLLPLLAKGEPAVQASVLDVLTFRRIDPGPALELLAGSEDPKLRAAALRAARVWPKHVDRARVQEALDAPEIAVRDAALETGAVLGMKAVWDRCQQIAAERAPGARLALVLLALGGEAKEREVLRGLLGEPALREDALWALGFTGRVEITDACIEFMRDEDERFARLAGEAFSAITGLEIAGRYVFAANSDESDEPAPATDSDLDEDLSPWPEDDLPLPDPGAIEYWWREARKGFRPDTNYLSGKPFEEATLREALAGAPMRRRHVLALALAIRSRGRYLLETRAPFSAQRRQLDALQALHADLTTPFKVLLRMH